jgi:hypothetical protein
MCPKLMPDTWFMFNDQKKKKNVHFSVFLHNMAEKGVDNI